MGAALAEKPRDASSIVKLRVAALPCLLVDHTVWRKRSRTQS